MKVHDFLLKNDVGVSYALVKYEGRIEAVYFVRHDFDDEPWFLESQPFISEADEITDTDIEKWCIGLADEILDPSTDRKEYYEKYMKPLIVGHTLYDIDSPQVEPYLPKDVDDIVLITERECLFYLLGRKQYWMMRELKHQ